MDFGMGWLMKVLVIHFEWNYVRFSLRCSFSVWFKDVFLIVNGCACGMIYRHYLTHKSLTTEQQLRIISLQMLQYFRK